MGKLFNSIYKNLSPVKYWKFRGARIGENTKISRKAELSTEPYMVEIGKSCYITSFVEFVPHDGSVHVLRNLDIKFKDIDLFKGKIIIGDNVFIGNHAAILSGVKIGSNCIIGYGSIVTKNIPDNSVVCGVPAKVICSLGEYLQKNEKYFLKTKQLSSSKKKKVLLETFK